ncbi:STM3941 family protein [Rhizobium giardinii]|uniref:STM3941 family protein n=1 Tax=Rhizobium giardinii TaxID=56731 RepID=UPI003D6FE960
MTDNALIIHRSKTKTLLLFCGAVGFVALGAFIAKTTYAEQGAGAFGVFIGLVSIVFFGFCGILILLKVFDGRPAVEFLKEGLLVREISPKPINWPDIIAARLIFYRNQPIVELILSPQAEQSLPFTRVVRYTRAANRGLGINGVCLSAAGLQMPASDIVDLIGEWAQKAQSAEI